MGYYPYEQECIHGHKWSAVFISVHPMRDSGQKRCPECGCFHVRRVWYIGEEGQCHMQHPLEEWEQEKKAIAKGEKYRRGQLDWEPES